MEQLSAVIEYLKKQGARFADAREHLFEERSLRFEDRRVSNLSEEHTNGVGVRVLFENGWGYASTPTLAAEGIRKAADEALAMAKTASAQSTRKIEFCEEPRHIATFETKIEEDPFKVSVGEIASTIIAANDEILKGQDIIKAEAYATFRRMKKRYANTEGSAIQTTIYSTISSIEAIARANDEVKSRAFSPPPMNAGYEYFRNTDYRKEATRIAAEAREHCFAKSCEDGETTLILDPEHLALTMHESVGHPTELDRVLGYEESCAGRSFATLDKYQTFRYGSDIVNFVADNTLDRGLATYGYDDEGVECQKWHIVKDGIFVGYGVNREVAGMIGLKRANGTTRATRYCDVPIVRIPNLYLAPGKKPLSKEALIADTERGIYIEGMGSFSIDQMRLNMQFGGDAFWEIKDGKIVGMLKNVTYNAISYEFWRKCDAICDEREFKRHGFLTCGKGDPMQLAQMSHGASPARFRNIMVRRAK